ncbi:MAG: iron-sulfur cluster carrier protein ApbC [Pseudomonadales bacterium]|nr:iron-sulfur cluster carrier protein ApbC [Pseudomonadales bacterium]
MSSNESVPDSASQLIALEHAAQACHVNAFGLSLGELKAHCQASVIDSAITLTVTLGLPIAALNNELHAALEKIVKPLTAGVELHIDIKGDIPAGSGNGKTQALPGVKNIIAVASGKGGVGKSATALNLALALRSQGASVGLLDADIYGPSQPNMMGVARDTRPEVEDQKYFLPVMAHGLQTMSMGYMVTEKTPMAWRGPMVSGALMQMIGQTRWNDLDYLLIDMPPGTGDIQLTLAQQVPCTGCVIVTTPQNIALLDARKGIEMFQKVGIDCLGIVENMATHICSQCGHEEFIFGTGGGESIAEEYAVPLLGSLPLAPIIREMFDQGQPIVTAQPDSPITEQYIKIAQQLALRVCQAADDTTVAVPEIIISDD